MNDINVNNLSHCFKICSWVFLFFKIRFMWYLIEIDLRSGAEIRKWFRFQHFRKHLAPLRKTQSSEYDYITLIMYGFLVVVVFFYRVPETLSPRCTMKHDSSFSPWIRTHRWPRKHWHRRLLPVIIVISEYDVMCVFVSTEAGSVGHRAGCEAVWGEVREEGSGQLHWSVLQLTELCDGERGWTYD